MQREKRLLRNRRDVLGFCLIKLESDRLYLCLSEFCRLVVHLLINASPLAGASGLSIHLRTTDPSVSVCSKVQHTRVPLCDL